MCHSFDYLKSGRDKLRCMEAIRSWCTCKCLTSKSSQRDTEELLALEEHSFHNRIHTALPQVPQFRLSEVKSGQAPLQGGRPLLVHLQAPEEQVAPLGHYRPCQSLLFVKHPTTDRVTAFATVFAIGLEVRARTIAWWEAAVDTLTSTRGAPCSGKTLRFGKRFVSTSRCTKALQYGSRLTTLPHFPQLSISVLVSLQAPLQSCSVGEVLRGPHT